MNVAQHLGLVDAARSALIAAANGAKAATGGDERQKHAAAALDLTRALDILMQAGQGWKIQPDAPREDGDEP